jgi:hypothetical protein
MQNNHCPIHDFLAIEVHAMILINSLPANKEDSSVNDVRIRQPNFHWMKVILNASYHNWHMLVHKNNVTITVQCCLECEVT